MQKAPDYQLISTLRSLDAEPRELKGKTLLFIPQVESAFWKIFAEPDRRSYAPLVGPATSGMALPDGRPPASCDLTDQYDTTVYSRRTLPQTPGRRHAVRIVRARDEKRVPEDRGAELQRSRNVFDSRYNVRSNRVE
jgi:hypothetical protein